MPTDLSVDTILARRREPLLSFEFFPPRDIGGMHALERAAADLLSLRPDFVTVTCGAGGSTRTHTREACALLREMGFGPVVPHLTCVGQRREELEADVDAWYDEGYRTLMALRGDPPEGQRHFRIADGGLAHASDLVGLLRDRYEDFCCGVAGYPEVHPESRSEELDTLYLKTKVMSGASFIVTQLFFEISLYRRFVDRCRAAGIYQPILPGLLPAVSLPQARRTVLRCRASLPAQLEVSLEDAGGTGEAAEAVGIRWAATQIRGMLHAGAPGVHLYVFNRARAALAPELARCLAEFRTLDAAPAGR